MIVYLIRNRVNGKVYVGKTTLSLARRWKTHLWTSKSKKNFNWPLHNAIRKYGAEAFTIEPIGEASSTAQLNDLEKFYIALLGSLDPAIGYNRTAGGDGVAGLFKFTVSKDDLARAIHSGMGVQEIADQHHVARATVTQAVLRYWGMTFAGLRKSWGLGKLGNDKISARLKGRKFSASHRAACIAHLRTIRQATKVETI